MTRRGTRFGKKGVASTFGGLDLGQDVDYLHFAGVDKLTDLSNGTKDITITGMTTLVSFTGSVLQSGVSPITMTIKSISANVVNIACHYVGSKNNGATTVAAEVSGTTLNWFAVGTQA